MIETPSKDIRPSAMAIYATSTNCITKTTIHKVHGTSILGLIANGSKLKISNNYYDSRLIPHGRYLVLRASQKDDKITTSGSTVDSRSFGFLVHRDLVGRANK